MKDIDIKGKLQGLSANIWRNIDTKKSANWKRLRAPMGVRTEDRYKTNIRQVTRKDMTIIQSGDLSVYALELCFVGGVWDRGVPFDVDGLYRRRSNDIEYIFRRANVKGHTEMLQRRQDDWRSSKVLWIEWGGEEQENLFLEKQNVP